MDVDLTGTVDYCLREIWTGVSNVEGDTFVLSDGADPSGSPTETDQSSVSTGDLGDYIAGRWTCLIQPANTGTYSFRNTRDDLGRMKLKLSADVESANRFNNATTSTSTAKLVAGRWYYYEARWYDLISTGYFNGQYSDPVAGTWRNIATVAGELTIRKWNGYAPNATMFSHW